MYLSCFKANSNILILRTRSCFKFSWPFLSPCKKAIRACNKTEILHVDVNESYALQHINDISRIILILWPKWKLPNIENIEIKFFRHASFGSFINSGVIAYLVYNDSSECAIMAYKKFLHKDLATAIIESKNNIPKWYCIYQLAWTITSQSWLSVTSKQICII